MTLTEKCEMLWARLRKERRSLVTQMRRADLQPSVLVHGVQFLRRVPAPVPLLYATHISEQRSLVSVDCAGTVRLHYEDGRLRGTRHLPWLVSGLLYASQVQLYVAWNRQELLLLDTSFTFLSRSPVQQGVSSCLYHPGRNLLFSAGCGGVLVWSLGHSRRSLVPQQSLSQGMSDEDTVSALTVDSTSPHVHTCYAACGTSVWEYDLSDGTLRSVRRHLHARPISRLLFSEKLRLLISGSRDGSIKVWDAAAQLMAVYVGHTGPVTGLSLTSSGTVLVSGSEDASLRTWDLSTQEQMEEQRVSESLLGLDAFCSSGHYIVSYGSHELHVWQVHNLYQLHCLLGTTVTNITVSEDLAPSRALCVGADDTVRLISSSRGQVIAALDGGERLLGAEYCALQGAVYVLLGDGNLLKATALTHPMQVVSRVKVSSPHSLPRCFSLFSCRVDKEAAFTDSRAASEQKPHEGSGEKEQSANRKNHRIFCIIGLDDGNLRVYNVYSNLLQCETEAHNPGHVTDLMSIPENQTIISAGSDLTVKVWRFFPYSEESLSLCMSFYCARPVGRLCSLNSQLFVAFHDSSSATYTLVQYCLKTGRRNDHPSSHDHQDQVTGLCASPGLGLVASCGRDRTIRLWTEDNRLLRILCLNALPESLSFCGSRGELLVGIHTHIYRIGLMKILPHPYKLKVMCMESPADTSDPTIPTQTSLISSCREDMKKRTQPRSHRTTMNVFQDSVEKTKENETVQESGEECGRMGPGADASAMSQECLLLSSRDRELHLIQMGKLRSRKRTKNNKETQREAMEKYLQLFYQEKPSYRIPDLDDLGADDLFMASGNQELKITPFFPLESDRGFFTDSALGFSIDSLPKPLQASFLAAGVFPNSALLQTLWPMKIEENLRPVRRRNEQKPKCTRPAEPSPGVEKETRSKDAEETTEEMTEQTTEDIDDIPPILQDILTTVNATRASPPAPEISSPQSPPAQVPKPARSTRPQKTRLSRIPRPPPVQAKEPAIPMLPPPSPPQLPPPADIVDRPPTASSASSQKDKLRVGSPEGPQIPPFILQFQDQGWFSMVLPEAEAQYSEFQPRLLRSFLQAGQPMRTELLSALQTLYQQGHLKQPELVFRTLRDAINGADLTVMEGQEFVWLCLRFMNDLSQARKELIVELLVMCVQLQDPHRGRFIALFHEFGVQDPHGFIAKKCRSWDSWDETRNSREALRKICEDWLQQWTDHLMDHLHAGTTWNKEPQTSHGGKSRSLGGNRTRPEDLLYDVTAIDVLNYYCDVQMKRELDALRDCEPKHGSTVLALPPIDRSRALLRLGETGMHGGQRDRAGGIFPAVRPLCSDIIPFINLPVKKVTLSPFISTEDAPTRTRFTGSLRQDIQRYFMVQQSYIERY